MTDKDRAKIKEIFQVSCDNERRAAVHDAAAILHRRASYHPDSEIKKLLTEIGSEIEALSPDAQPPTKGSTDVISTPDRPSPPERRNKARNDPRAAE